MLPFASVLRKAQVQVRCFGDWEMLSNDHEKRERQLLVQPKIEQTDLFNLKETTEQ